MLSASTPSVRAISSDAATIASRLGGGLAGRSLRLRGAGGEDMPKSILDTNVVRYVQCSSRTAFVISLDVSLPDPNRGSPYVRRRHHRPGPRGRRRGRAARVPLALDRPRDRP